MVDLGKINYSRVTIQSIKLFSRKIIFLLNNFKDVFRQKENSIRLVARSFFQKKNRDDFSILVGERQFLGLLIQMSKQAPRIFAIRPFAFPDK